MLKKRTLIALSIIGIIILTGVAFLVKNFSHIGGDNDGEGYNTYTVKSEKPIRISGKVSPETIKTYLNNAQLGTFLSIQVEDGQSVSQGTPLINYDIDGAQRQKLNDQLVKAQQSGDQQAINTAWKQLNRYDGQVNNSINATFDGTISLINRQQVGESEPILKLISKEPIIQTTVSEFDLNKIKVGDTVNIEVTSSGQKGKGKIKSIAQLPTSYDQDKGQHSETTAGSLDENAHGDAQTLTTNNPIDAQPSGQNDKETSKYKIIIGDLDFKVKAGFSVEANIPLDTLKIPKSVLTKDNHVYKVDKNNIAHRTKIKYDEKNGDLIVTQGIEKGDHLIQNPDSKIKDGEKVEVAK
ncbi:efflux RND transporter periplasmic adaptor subunit [Staphylococcus coagulans]|uniref:efflux RND transporter periplasmic adaptor subunit n=1 Tax=Staphylococcus coagulans TaxID=74706 RepID=UPI0035A614BE